MPPITQGTFTWFCQDPDWKNKFLVGSLMCLAGSIVPVVGWLGMIIALGYGLAAWRVILRDEPPHLPPWEHYDVYFLDGLKAILAGMLYLLPLVLLIAAALLLLFGSLTIAILTDLNADAPSARSLVALSAGYAGFLSALVLSSLFAFLLAIPHAIAIGQYVRTGKISAGYRVEEVWKIFRANLGGFIGALVVNWALGIALSLVTFLLYFTVILCLLNQFVLAPIMFYQVLMWIYWFGNAYRQGVHRAELATGL